MTWDDADAQPGLYEKFIAAARSSDDPSLQRYRRFPPRGRLVHHRHILIPTVSYPADELELSNLKRKTIAQLRGLWTKQGGRGEPPKVKILLLRELTWHAQQSLRGGMNAEQDLWDKVQARIKKQDRQTRHR